MLAKPNNAKKSASTFGKSLPGDPWADLRPPYVFNFPYTDCLYFFPANRVNLRSLSYRGLRYKGVQL